MPANALATLAEQLRADDSVISPHVVDPAAGAPVPPLAALVAAGPGAAADPPGYAVVVESVREGYLLHYAEPRVLAVEDGDLRLLAGDYLYALGLERLAALGDLAAVRELSDLISLSAQLHADGGADADGGAHGHADAGREAGVVRGEALAVDDALWIASVTAIAAGSYEPLGPAKTALRASDPAAKAALDAAAGEIAASAGLSALLADVRAGIDSRAVRPN